MFFCFPGKKNARDIMPLPMLQERELFMSDGVGQGSASGAGMRKEGLHGIIPEGVFLRRARTCRRNMYPGACAECGSGVPSGAGMESAGKTRPGHCF